MKLIPAIQTRYKGYRFRSRLEARWAVFLDHLGVKWEYEKEGYVLLDGTPYLPDFWLPDQGGFLEIKGGYALRDYKQMDDARVKAAKLATSSGHGVLLVTGSLGSGEYLADLFHPKDLAEPETEAWLAEAPPSIRALGLWGLPEELVIPGRMRYPEHFAWFKRGFSLDYHDGRLLAITCEGNLHTWLVTEPSFGHDIELEGSNNLVYGGYDLVDPYEPFTSGEGTYDLSAAYTDALAAARSARFEHGESGAT